MLGGHSLTFVLLPTSSMPSGESFRLAWREISNDIPLPIEKAWDEDSVVFELGGIMTIATLVSAPVPNQEAEAAAPLSLSALCAEGFSPTAHVAHLMVASTSPTASPVERLLGHTRVVAALTKAGNAVGVYEGNAHATHDPSFYVDIVSEGSDLPLVLWNGISIARTKASVELLTLGMSQLELPDLLLVAPSEQGNDALAFAFDLLDYVVRQGGPITEGETVGRTAEEKLPVKYVPSPIEPGTRVMRVDLTHPKKL